MNLADILKDSDYKLSQFTLKEKDPNYFERITDIPKASQTLEDILQIKFTLDDLIQNDRLVHEKRSLKSLIKEMEDEVLDSETI